MIRTHSLSMFGAVLLAGAVGIGAVATAHAYPGQNMASQARVSLAQARHIALSAQPGTITDQDLEKESGGSGLRYSFDVKAGSVTHEVGVDARSGKVLENSVEGPNAD